MQKKYIFFWTIELLIIVILCLAYFITKDKGFSRCFIYEKTNLLCPTCGGTRCVVNFVQMDWKESFKNHPVFFITIIYILLLNVVFLINVLTNKECFKWLYPSMKKYSIFIAILIFFTIIRNL